MIESLDRNRDQNCSGINELEHTPVNSDVCENGFGCQDHNLKRAGVGCTLVLVLVWLSGTIALNMQVRGRKEREIKNDGSLSKVGLNLLMVAFQ